MDEKRLQSFRDAFGFGGKKNLIGWTVATTEQQVEQTLGKGAVGRLRKGLSETLKDAPSPDLSNLKDKKADEVTLGTINVMTKLIMDDLQIDKPNPPKGADALEAAKQEKFQGDLDVFHGKMDALASLPGKDMTKEDRYLLRAVILTRFGVQLEGELGGSALRRLYQLMRDLPIGHTEYNKALGSIQRTKPPTVEGGDPPTYAKNGKVITLPIKRVATKTRIMLDGEQVGEPISYFDHSTPHEIGHSVDDKLKLMDTKGTNDDFGGWQPADIAGIANLAFGHFKIVPVAASDQRDYPDILAAGLRGDVTEKNFPFDGEEKIREALQWCAKMRLKDGKHGAWQLKGSELQDLAIGGRVYQQAYNSTWVSYSVGARAGAVSSYQFRAPGEWFAEIYAAYYGGLIKRTDPRVAWFKGEIDAPGV